MHPRQSGTELERQAARSVVAGEHVDLDPLGDGQLGGQVGAGTESVETQTPGSGNVGALAVPGSR